MSVIRSLRALIIETASSAETAVKIGSTALNAGLEATEGWAKDRSEGLKASEYSRRLNLMERVREDAKRALAQGLDPSKVLTLSFSDCLNAAVRDLEAAKAIRFEPLD